MSRLFFLPSRLSLLFLTTNPPHPMNRNRSNTRRPPPTRVFVSFFPQLWEKVPGHMRCFFFFNNAAETPLRSDQRKSSFVDPDSHAIAPSPLWKKGKGGVTQWGLFLECGGLLRSTTTESCSLMEKHQHLLDKWEGGDASSTEPASTVRNGGMGGRGGGADEIQ